VEIFWISTVRADGRPRVTPLPATCLDGALHFGTGLDEQKGRNLGRNPNCILTTKNNSYRQSRLEWPTTSSRVASVIGRRAQPETADAEGVVPEFAVGRRRSCVRPRRAVHPDPLAILSGGLGGECSVCRPQGQRFAATLSRRAQRPVGRSKDIGTARTPSATLRLVRHTNLLLRPGKCGEDGLKRWGLPKRVVCRHPGPATHDLDAVASSRDRRWFGRLHGAIESMSSRAPLAMRLSVTATPRAS
jgi:hypothetical protein